MATSKKLTGQTLFDLTLYVADTHVSPLVQQANATEQTTHDTFGLGLERPLASYDLNTQSWKMYEATFLLDFPPFSGKWPASGMTQNGKLFQRPRLVPRTLENESLSWPTPTAVVRPMEGNVRMYRAKVLNGQMTEAEAEAMLGKSVWEAHSKIPAMWPTPTYGKLAGGTGGMQQIEAKYLAGEIKTEERRAMRAGNGGRLNPMWVEWLMGFPLGWTDLEDSETL